MKYIILKLNLVTSLKKKNNIYLVHIHNNYRNIHNINLI